MDTITTESIIKTSSITPWPRKLYRNAEEFWRNSQGFHYAYLIYRTLRGDHKRTFQPDAVFYVGKSPAAYLKNVDEIREEDVGQWQRFLWNQAIVPMLIIKSPIKVRVYTAYSQPQKSDSTEKIQSLLEDTADALKLDKLWTAIESGMIYELKPEAFKREHAVDQYLLDNLNAAGQLLAKTQPGKTKEANEENLEFAHHFLTRLLFVCYLIERGMIGKHFNDSEHEFLKELRPATDEKKGYFLKDLFEDLNTYSKKREALCRIFGYVKRTFNGSLFPESIATEKDRYTDDFIKIVDDFLHGHELRTGQKLLGFWAYDFSVIPIETISAVYESFLGEQGEIKEVLGGKNSKRTTGAYYTPLHLVELTVDIALEKIKNKKSIHKLKILDPACGSGVFLVSLFGRMAESLRRQETQTKGINWARKLLPKLHQLYGIDISQTACHITCFSLYLALLEQLEPSDVEYLHEHDEKLPPLLANTRPDSWDTVYPGNLFNTELSFKEKDFDIVIGNPPWVSRGNQKDEHFLKWLTSKKNTDIYGPEKQIAHGFMWEVPKYLSDSGIACLLLPTTVLLNNHTNQFQKEWFKSVTVERVVNFSDLRFILFKSAIHPCVAISFKSVKSNPESIIRYESPKTDIRSQKGGPVYIREEDTTCLYLKEITFAAANDYAPTVWKTHYWGSWRDQRLLSRLMDFNKLSDLAGEIGKHKKWIKGQGIQVGGGDPNPVWWKPSTLYLDSEVDFDLIICKDDLITIKQAEIPIDTVHRPRDKKLFIGPKVLLAKGSRRVFFCNQEVVFRDTFTSITGTEKDTSLLRFLAVVLNSDLVYYYLFHTNSNLGIYRSQTYPNEFLSVPFFLPENAVAPDRAKEIVSIVAKQVGEFENSLKNKKWFGEEQKRKDKANKIRIRLELLIREYYNVDKYESMLIDDTLNLAVKSFHPRENTAKAKIPTLVDVNDEQAKEYVNTLCEMLNNFGEGSNFKVNGEIIKGQPYSVVQISLAETIDRNVPVLDANKKLEQTFEKMKTLLQNKQGRFVFCQNLKVFDGDNLYILKPMQMRFWSRTAALNDADEIAGAILNSREKNK